ncbi:DUF488 family protein [Muricauda sp. ANG21]|uniref:DUF488 domain-containing protein n=1 Tax=Allomuricauda sp. ANG21 TaxID=3042468 RepID=UPI0034525408
MYYRRKICLSMLQVFGNELDKIQLQKLLFLHSRYKTKGKNYDFVPYKYGAFSFQANADLHTLEKYGIVEEKPTSWKKTDSTDYLRQINRDDEKILRDFGILYKDKSSEDLIKLTYKNFPYYAINSTIAHKYLSDNELKKVEQLKLKDNEVVLYTIGYEGLSLESYLNKLIRSGVKLLCDVRRNAASMKYGFNKRQLENACAGVEIQYLHIPEVGIESEKRKELTSQIDYDQLFDDYKSTNLSNTKTYQEKILNLLIQNKKVALTCFEADNCQCHRTHLADAISKFPSFKFEIEHL